MKKTAQGRRGRREGDRHHGGAACGEAMGVVVTAQCQWAARGFAAAFNPRGRPEARARGKRPAARQARGQGSTWLEVRHAHTGSLRSEATAAAGRRLLRLTFSFPTHGRAVSTLFFHRCPSGSHLAVGGGPSIRAAALHHLNIAHEICCAATAVASQAPSKLKTNQALAARQWSAAL